MHYFENMTENLSGMLRFDAPTSYVSMSTDTAKIVKMIRRYLYCSVAHFSVVVRWGTKGESLSFCLFERIIATYEWPINTNRPFASLLMSSVIEPVLERSIKLCVHGFSLGGVPQLAYVYNWWRQIWSPTTPQFVPGNEKRADMFKIP